MARPMPTGMLRLRRENREIVGMVVVEISVDMMNDLAWQ